MPRQQLPSIQEIFGETHPLAISTGQSYAWPADTRHAAPPASPAMYGIEHSNEEAPSNEQGLFFKTPTVERSLGIVPPTNVLKHPEVNHPKSHSSRRSHFSRTFSRRLSVENSTSSSVSSQEASVPRHHFCRPKILLPSTSPNDCSLNEPYNFSTHPDVSIPQPGSVSCGPVDPTQPSFTEPPNMSRELHTRRISILIPPESQHVCQSEKNTPSFLDFRLSFHVVRNYYPGQAFQHHASPFPKLCIPSESITQTYI